MATALDFIKAAMKKGGILTKTENPTADEASDALDTLNYMLESWANDGLTVPYRTLEGFGLTSGTANYTIGSGGDFDTVRPVQVVSAYIRDDSTDSPVIEISDQMYGNIASKSASGLPEYFNFTNAYPLATIRVFPTPSSNYTLYLLTEKTVGGYSLASVVSLPPGWARAIINSLAIELCGEYGVQVPQEVQAVAGDALSKIRLSIAKNRQLDSTPMAFSGFDINTGWQN